MFMIRASTREVTYLVQLVNHRTKPGTCLLTHKPELLIYPAAPLSQIISVTCYSDQGLCP